MADHHHTPTGTRTTGEDPRGSTVGWLGWALIPLIPSIIIVAYFLIDGKIHL